MQPNKVSYCLFSMPKPTDPAGVDRFAQLLHQGARSANDINVNRLPVYIPIGIGPADVFLGSIPIALKSQGTEALARVNMEWAGATPYTTKDDRTQKVHQHYGGGLYQVNHVDLNHANGHVQLNCTAFEDGVDEKLHTRPARSLVLEDDILFFASDEHIVASAENLDEFYDFVLEATIWIDDYIKDCFQAWKRANVPDLHTLTQIMIALQTQTWDEEPRAASPFNTPFFTPYDLFSYKDRLRKLTEQQVKRKDANEWAGEKGFADIFEMSKKARKAPAPFVVQDRIKPTAAALLNAFAAQNTADESK